MAQGDLWCRSFAIGMAQGDLWCRSFAIGMAQGDLSVSGVVATVALVEHSFRKIFVEAFLLELNDNL